MKKKDNISEQELIQQFNNAGTIQERVKLFARIQDEDTKMELLLKIPEKERYRFIGYLKETDNISLVLSCYNENETRDKTFQYVAKRYKGNIKQLLEIICRIRF